MFVFHLSLSSQAPSLALHRHHWFAHDVQQFLAYCRSRGSDKRDVELLAAEYVDTIPRGEPPFRECQILLT
jgi:hypothetical protein